MTISLAWIDAAYKSNFVGLYVVTVIMDATILAALLGKI